MKILAIDTSSQTCGVCILEDKNKIFLENIITDRSHSIKLMPIIEEAFKKSNLSLKDINLIVCDKGPGSFTGIRIGVATAKAFADSLDKTLIGVSSLEALACKVLISNTCKEGEFICSILNAKNDNCYIALYKNENGMYKEILSPFSASLDTAITILKVHAKSSTTFIGDGVECFKEKLQKELPNSEFSEDNTLDAYSLGIAGYFKCINNNIDDALPMYLKKPQAQKQLEEKLNGNTNS